MLKAYKYRLYPTKEQAEYLSQVFGSVRFVWNQHVANFNEYSSCGPNRPMDEKILKDNPEYKWLNDSISYALQQKRMDFIETKKQFFNKNRKSKLGKMKFKKKGISNDSFRIPIASMGGAKSIDLDRGTVKLPKMTPLKMVVDRKFTGEPRSVTVSKNKSNQYFISILVEEEIVVKPRIRRSIGIDLGFIDFLTLSNGMKINNPRWFRESQSKLAVNQRHLSRKTKGSNRYNKQKLKVAKIHQKITNQRKWFHHNLSTWLIDNFDTIICEDLNIAGMKKLFGKSASDAGFASFVSMLDYKSKWHFRSFHKVDRFYPSSKTCSCCGYKMDSMELSIREWYCPNCNTTHDRDLNAATNILNKGLDDLYGLTSEELSDYKRGEAVRPEVDSLKASSLKRLASFIEIYKTV